MLYSLLYIFLTFQREEIEVVSRILKALGFFISLPEQLQDLQRPGQSQFHVTNLGNSGPATEKGLHDFIGIN